MVTKELYLYSARDTATGKLVSDITNPGKKYWQNKAAAVAAIDKYNNKVSYYGRYGRHDKLELVVWKLTEVSYNE